MDTNILKTVGQIAGIGGLALGVFLILFREVIRKNIFPQLPKGQAYKLLRMIIILIFIITIVGIGGWVYVERASTPIEDRATLLAEFVLDENGNPQFTKRDESLNDYKIRVSLKNVPPDVASVTYDPMDSSYEETFPGGSGPDFKTEFFSYGELNIKVILSKPGSESVMPGQSLAAALEKKYAADKNPAIRNAIKQIKKN